MSDYQLSQHAKERYAERVMGRDSPGDVARFIAQHEDKIIGDVNKLIEYGEVVYTGRSLSDFANKAILDISVKDQWVVVSDPGSKRVVTLFKIDLGVGDEMNKNYISLLLSKLNDEKEKYSQACQQIDAVNNEYQSIIKSNTETINEYKSLIKSLESQNADYQSLINESETNKKIAEEGVRKIVGVLTGKKIF